MNFGPDADEMDLESSFRELVRRRIPIDVVRRAEGGGLDRELWQVIADAGVFSIMRSEAAGGAGLGSTAAALVFKELGRALIAGPLVGTYLWASRSDEAARGERIVGVVERSAANPVAHLGDLDDLVVLDDGGVWLVAPADVTCRPSRHPLDPLTPMFHIDELPRGERVGDKDEAEQTRLIGTALTASLLLGIAEATGELAAAYSLQRRQFNRPIGSFQAIKHLLADMVVRAEVARAATYAAAAILDDPTTGDTTASTSGAKILASQAAFLNSKANIQVMGGMGFTWEMPPHLYLKRALVLEAQFGTTASHEARIAAGM